MPWQLKFEKSWGQVHILKRRLCSRNISGSIKRHPAWASLAWLRLHKIFCKQDSRSSDIILRSEHSADTLNKNWSNQEILEIHSKQVLFIDNDKDVWICPRWLCCLWRNEIFSSLYALVESLYKLYVLPVDSLYHSHWDFNLLGLMWTKMEQSTDIHPVNKKSVYVRSARTHVLQRPHRHASMLRKMCLIWISFHIMPSSWTFPYSCYGASQGWICSLQILKLNLRVDSQRLMPSLIISFYERVWRFCCTIWLYNSQLRRMILSAFWGTSQGLRGSVRPCFH